MELLADVVLLYPTKNKKMSINVKLFQQKGYTTKNGSVDYYKAQKENGEIIYLQRFSYEDKFTQDEWRKCSIDIFENDDSPVVNIYREETIEP